MAPAFPTQNHHGNLTGILAMLVAMFSFCTSDMLVKLLTESLPLGEVMFVRGLVTIVLIGALAARLGELHGFRRVLHRSVFLRTLGEVMAAIFFLTALIHLALPTVTIIHQAVPLAVAAASAGVLGESVHWRRWTAIAVGFLGVIVVMRPGLEGFSPWSLLVIGAVLSVTLRDLSTKFIPSAVPTVLVVAVACVAATAAGGGMGLFLSEPWRMPEGVEIAYLVGGAVCLTVGHWFIILALRVGSPSVSTGFRYSVVVWALVYGYVIWGDRPDTLTWIGTTMIVGSGVYTFHRERLLARRALAGYHAGANEQTATAERGGG
ncbi:MAG: DMT family transporter [Bauldia sp.]